jgi:hypothetical protein
MGHQHLLNIPKSKEWRQVVALISGGASMARIAGATSRAVERSMIEAADDPTVRQTFYLLTQLPLAARAEDFGKELRRLGLHVGASPTLIEIGNAMMESIDQFTWRLGRRTDYGEIAQLSAVESIQAVAGRELPDLFGAGHDRVQNVVASLGTVKQFALLARDFFSRLTRRHLNFYLHRELSNHVGVGRRFSSMAEHQEFEAAFSLHCRESSRIIKEFAGEWFSKHVFEGGIDRDKAGRFVHVAAKKIREELRRREPEDA